jgi:hypothetical protein
LPIAKAGNFRNFRAIMAFVKNTAKSKSGDRPDLPKRLFWDWNFTKINWQHDYLAVIDRVIERGNKDQWKEMLKYYGESKVIKVLKSEIKYLPDYAIDDVCDYFKMKKEELACYARTQSRQGHWI